MSGPRHPLDALEQALSDERQALLDNDVDNLLASNKAKLAALDGIERFELDGADAERVRELIAKNSANKVLLARRRREVTWSLRYLGMTGAGSTYRQDGTTKPETSLRYFGAG